MEGVFSNDHSYSNSLNDETGQFHWQTMEREDYRPVRPVLFFDRHGACKNKNTAAKGADVTPPIWTKTCEYFEKSVMHYETYEQGDALGRLVIPATDQVDSKFPDRPLAPAVLGFSFLEAGLTKVLIVDERLDPMSQETTYRSVSGLWECSYKELFHWKGIDIRGAEYASNQIPPPEHLIKLVKNARTAGNLQYDFLVLHKGIVDKLIKSNENGNGANAKELMADLFARLREHVRHIVVHSGRMSVAELPPGVKFMALSNVDAWVKGNYPKMQIVEDLRLLRRP